MYDRLLPVSIYLVDSILSGIYSQGFLKEKYGKKAVLAVWGAAFFSFRLQYMKYWTIASHSMKLWG